MFDAGCLRYLALLACAVLIVCASDPAWSQEPDDYLTAVALYQRGMPVAAIKALSDLSEQDIRKNAEALAHDANTNNLETVRLAGLLHVELAATDRNIPGRHAFDVNADLGRQLLRRVDEVRARLGRPGPSEELAATQALALFLLDDVSGRDARLYIERWLRRFPHDARLLLAAGEACESTNRYDSLTRLGLAHVEEKENSRLSDALHYFDAALAKDPLLVEAHVHKAVVELMLERPSDASRDLVAALSSNPSRDWKYLSFLTLARLQLRAGALDRAEGSAHEALTLVPTAQSAVLLVAAVKDMRGDHDAAVNAVRVWLTHGGAFADDPWWDYRMEHWKAGEHLLDSLKNEVRP